MVSYLVFWLGVEVMNFYIGKIEELQKIENRVYRRILGAVNSTPISVMRGEIGASLMRSRIIESRLTLVRSLIESENRLVKEVGHTNPKWHFSYLLHVNFSQTACAIRGF